MRRSREGGSSGAAAEEGKEAALGRVLSGPNTAHCGLSLLSCACRSEKYRALRCTIHFRYLSMLFLLELRQGWFESRTIRDDDRSPAISRAKRQDCSPIAT